MRLEYHIDVTSFGISYHKLRILPTTVAKGICSPVIHIRNRALHTSELVATTFPEIGKETAGSKQVIQFPCFCIEKWTKNQRFWEIVSYPRIKKPHFSILIRTGESRNNFLIQWFKSKTQEKKFSKSCFETGDRETSFFPNWFESKKQETTFSIL